eukprot:355077-Chlamydomonas_euryale.AAC.2
MLLLLLVATGRPQAARILLRGGRVDWVCKSVGVGRHGGGVHHNARTQYVRTCSAACASVQACMPACMHIGFVDTLQRTFRIMFLPRLTQIGERAPARRLLYHGRRSRGWRARPCMRYGL